MTNDHFTRKTFSTSRLAEFASQAELIKATGHPVERWLLVIVKELIDNALDESEEAGVAPHVRVTISENAITVTDHGRGVAPEVVAALVDYEKRTSSRAAYVSPTRGAQGNALQSIIPMGFSLDQGQPGEVTIESRGVKHVIRFSVDPVRRTPVVNYNGEAPSEIKIGASVTVCWPHSAGSIIANVRSEFLSLTLTYAWLNPHLTLEVVWQGEDLHRRSATDPSWSKWKPSQPTSAHWYDHERLKTLMAAEIAYAQDHGVSSISMRDFVGQFRGLTSVIKQSAICTEVGIAGRMSLENFFRGADRATQAQLLREMQIASTPVKAKDLGLIGEDHLEERFSEIGCEGFTYKRAEIYHDGLPIVIEAAFGKRSNAGLTILAGFNFAPGIGGLPFERDFLGPLHVAPTDSIVLFVHAVSLRFDFLDRGKSRLALAYAVKDKVEQTVTHVIAKWTRYKKAQIRDANAAWKAQRSTKVTLKDAAWEEMRAAYMKASANNTLPANARQIYYAIRGPVQEKSGETLTSKYFVQTLLPDFMNATENADLTADWDVVFDDRGHFAEPHTQREIGLGTINVRNYIHAIGRPKIVPTGVALARVSTYGPSGRYSAVLFVEKEGFEPILQAAGISERFDLAVMSSKGMSVTAARMMVEELCGERGLPLFVLHDFDISGFSILKTLTTTNRRYTFDHEIEPIDLGLRLADVAGLDSEDVAVSQDHDALTNRLRINGATDSEIEFLLSGRRVELNAMNSRQFIDFLERKLRANGVVKLVPSPQTLSETFVALKRGDMARAALEAEVARLNAVTVDVPADLEARVREHLAAQPEATWDAAVLTVISNGR